MKHSNGNYRRHIGKYLFFGALFLFQIQGLTGQVFTQIIGSDDSIQNVIPWYFEDEPTKYLIPEIDVDSILDEDAENDPPILRYGVLIETNYDESDGSYYSLGGYKMWKLGIRSAGASELSFNFSNMYLPAPSLMYIYGDSNRMVIGPIDSSQLIDSSYSTDLINGDSATIFVIMVDSLSSGFSITLEGVVHGVGTHAGVGFGESLWCERNVECFTGWEDEVNAVCLILDHDGEEWCSGALIVDACLSFSSYVLTADHCLNNDPAKNSRYKFRFHYESRDCTPTTSQLWVTLYGAEVMANWDSSDFALLEIQRSILGMEDLALAGWDRTAQEPTGTTLIHHPLGDVKKQTFDGGQSTIEPNPPPGYPLASNHLLTFVLEHGVNDDVGQMENGSSGSPHFNDNQRIIGQHWGGQKADCSSAKTFHSGRFFESWLGGGNATDGLVNWLGGNGNPTTMNTIRVPWIDGDGVICDDNPIFNLINPIPGSTINWSIDGEMYDAAISGSGTSAELSSFDNEVTGSIGLVTYTASNFGCNTIDLTQEFWIGPPAFELKGDTELDCGIFGLATIMPTGLKDQGVTNVQWTFNGEISGSGGPVMAKYQPDPPLSTYVGQVCATLTNPCGSTQECFIVHIDCSNPKKRGGSDEAEDETQTNLSLLIFPNPAGESIKVSLIDQKSNIHYFAANSSREGTVHIIDYLGRTLGSYVYNGGTLDIPISELSEGLYLVTVSIGTYSRQKTLVISN